MDYEAQYKDAYNKALECHDTYLRTALEEECHIMNDMVCDYSISDEDYENVILPYWKKYNRRPKKFWFEFNGSRDNILNPAFIPSDMYFTELIPYLNNLEFAWAICDKCYLDCMFKNVAQPKTIVKCIAGLYYDKNMNLISEKDAIRMCLDYEGEFVIKASIYTGNSRKVFSLDPNLLDESSMLEKFRYVGANFIVQDRIKQHKDLAMFNPTTVNTIRIVSLLTEEGVYMLAALFRIGGEGESVIEEGKGGYYVEIKDDNSLSDISYRVDVKSHFDKDGVQTKEHILTRVNDRMGGLHEASYRIPAMDKIRKIVSEIHPMTPHLRYVGWDFTINESGEPVFIENNFASDSAIIQMACCKPTFGDMTEYVLDDYFIHRTLEKNHRQGHIFR